MEFFETYQGQLEILLMVGFAMLLGGIIGFEREIEHKPAGLPTPYAGCRYGGPSLLP